MLAGVIFGGVALAYGYSYLDAGVFMLGIVVANVPEALRSTRTVAQARSARRMAKNNCLAQNMEAVDTIGAVSVIVTNKTGLIAQDVMTPRHVLLPRGSKRSLQLLKFSCTYNS
jgi:Ca2+-transporting ATPase